MEDDFLSCPFENSFVCRMEDCCVGCEILEHYMIKQKNKDLKIKELEYKIETLESVADRVESGYYTKKESGGC